MSGSEIGLLVGAAALIAVLAWYFFGPKKSREAELRDGVQEVTITVKGGYSPDLIRVRQGVPIRLMFDRQEGGDCTSRVVFPDFAVAESLPAFKTSTVELMPDTAGRYGFAGGMNMVRGTLVVEPNDETDATPARTPATEPDPKNSAPENSAPENSAPENSAVKNSAVEREAAEAGARQAEMADLSRRVAVGAVLSFPVVLAVMLSEVFGVAVPALPLNHWFQLALITPVMFYTGWPIHRTGWLSLRHRSAEMNALITLGTTAAYGYSVLVTMAPTLLPAGVREVYFRGGRGDPHPDPARPPVRGEGQGGYRAGDPRAPRPSADDGSGAAGRCRGRAARRPGLNG